MFIKHCKKKVSEGVSLVFFLLKKIIVSYFIIWLDQEM